MIRASSRVGYCSRTNPAVYATVARDATAMMLAPTTTIFLARLMTLWALPRAQSASPTSEAPPLFSVLFAVVDGHVGPVLLSRGVDVEYEIVDFDVPPCFKRIGDPSEQGWDMALADSSGVRLRKMLGRPFWSRRVRQLLVLQTVQFRLALPIYPLTSTYPRPRRKSSTL